MALFNHSAVLRATFVYNCTLSFWLDVATCIITIYYSNILNHKKKLRGLAKEVLLVLVQPLMIRIFVWEYKLESKVQIIYFLAGKYLFTSCCDKKPKLQRNVITNNGKTKTACVHCFSYICREHKVFLYQTSRKFETSSE